MTTQSIWWTCWMTWVWRRLTISRHWQPCYRQHRMSTASWRNSLHRGWPAPSLHCAAFTSTNNYLAITARPGVSLRSGLRWACLPHFCQRLFETDANPQFLWRRRRGVSHVWSFDSPVASVGVHCLLPVGWDRRANPHGDLLRTLFSTARNICWVLLDIIHDPNVKHCSHLYTWASCTYFMQIGLSSENLLECYNYISVAIVAILVAMMAIKIALSE